MDGPNNGIVLYHYSFSPYARRIIWYLALRGIDYAQCNQPPVLPRPDVKALGVTYRRIPLMTIGRDVFADTRLMLLKLERMFPEGALGASIPDQIAVQKLLEMWTIDGGVFLRASQLIPPSMPLLNDPKFTKDREDFSGRSWDKERITAMRPEALAHIRNSFKFLETTLLADNRQWILKTEKPSLADIEAIWAFDWLNGLKQALPPELISSKQYPKVFAWIARFNQKIKAARAAAPKPTTLKGGDALERIITSNFADEDLSVDEQDPLALKKGDEIEVWPIDTGFRHKDRGRLIGLNDEEVVLSVKAPTSGKELHLHCPRTNFRIAPATSGAASRL